MPTSRESLQIENEDPVVTSKNRRIGRDLENNPPHLSGDHSGDQPSKKAW